jgi:hypothetical protein
MKGSHMSYKTRTNRNDLIEAILMLKPSAVKAGFDWPSQNIKKGDTRDLIIFLGQLAEFFLDEDEENDRWSERY